MWKNVRLSADVRIFAAHLLLGTMLTIFVVMNANGLLAMRQSSTSTVLKRSFYRFSGSSSSNCQLSNIAAKSLQSQDLIPDASWDIYEQSNNEAGCGNSPNNGM